MNWDCPLPQKVAGVCPCTLTPWSPYYQDRRKETESYLKSDGQCPDGTWRAGCFRGVPKPVSQQNGQIWGPRVLPQLALLPRLVEGK